MGRALIKIIIEIWPSILMLVMCISFAIWGFYLHSDAEIVEYPDSAGYHHVALNSWRSHDFLAGQRCLTTPLIWKMLKRTSTETIKTTYARVPIFSTVFSLASWILLAWSVVMVLQVTWLKIATLFFILGIGTSRMIFFWNWILLSESLAISSFILLVALAMLLIRQYINQDKLSWLKRSVLVLITIALIPFWCFSRDTNSVVALSIGFVLTLLLLLRWKKLKSRISLILLILAFIGVALAQFSTANTAKRWHYPFVNVLGQRILTDREYTQFFIDRGMPNTSDVMLLAGKWANFYDWRGTNNELNKWLHRDAQEIYLQFLLMNPTYTLFRPLTELADLIDTDWSNYGGESVNNKIQNRLTAILWPHGTGLAVLSALAAISLVFMIASRKISPYYLFASVMLILVIPAIYATWHGDAMEVVRHSVNHSIQLRISLLLMTIFGLNQVLASNPRLQDSNEH